MSYRTEVEARFTFTDSQTLLTIGDAVYDLGKIETLEEWRLTLVAIASPKLAARPAPSTVPVNPPSATGTMDQIHQMTEAVKAQTAAARQEVAAQYDSLKSTYEDTLESITGTKPERSGSPA